MEYQQFPGVSTCEPSTAASWLRRLGESLFARHWAGKARRFLAVHFRPTYVSRQLTKRGGTCLRCGRCCTLAFTCPLLLQGDGCAAYELPRPKACRAFPIDGKDLGDVAATGGRCGYWFPEGQVGEGTGGRVVNRGGTRLEGGGA
jgi:hypothetical protein